MATFRFFLALFSLFGELTIENCIVYGERNSERMRDYHRLDLGAIFKTTTAKGRQSEWIFSIYNAYCRLNPYYYYYEDNSITDDLQLMQVSYFPFIPSVSYKVYF